MKIVLYQLGLKIFISAYSLYIYNTDSTHDDKQNKFRCSLHSDRSPIQSKKISHALLYVFVWVISRSLSFHLYRLMKMEQSVPKRRHVKFRRRGITQKKTYNNA